MATVNLGSIKFNWKGSYSGATAYVVDDVVESSGSSYICIAATTGNAPPNASYWEQMSSAGTNGTDGTDLTTTLTTQGDLVYYNGSALARLGAGTSGQVLQTNGTGANPSWGTVSSSMVSAYAETTANQTVASSSLVDLTGITVTVTPSSTSSKFLIVGRVQAQMTGIGFGLAIVRNSTVIFESESANEVYNFDYEVNPFMFIDSPNTTSATTYKIQVKTYNGNSGDFQVGGNSNICVVEILG